MRNLISRLCCRWRGHTWGKYKLGVRGFGPRSLRIVKDTARRACSCCGKKEEHLLAFS